MVITQQIKPMHHPRLQFKTLYILLVLEFHPPAFSWYANTLSFFVHVLPLEQTLHGLKYCLGSTPMARSVFLYVLYVRYDLSMACGPVDVKMRWCDDRPVPSLVVCMTCSQKGCPATFAIIKLLDSRLKNTAFGLSLTKAATPGAVESKNANISAMPFFKT